MATQIFFIFFKNDAYTNRFRYAQEKSFRGFRRGCFFMIKTVADLWIKMLNIFLIRRKEGISKTAESVFF